MCIRDRAPPKSVPIFLILLVPKIKTTITNTINNCQILIPPTPIFISLIFCDFYHNIYFFEANEILGFVITKTMFGDDSDALKETRVTQPAIFLHSTILSEVMSNRFQPEMVSGHSLGEFSALVASGVLSFNDGLSLVKERAMAMQSACDQFPGTMAAILGLEDKVVESVCKDTTGVVIAANYNCPGQIVISGSRKAIDNACICLLYTSPSPRDLSTSRMPSSA